MGAPYAIGIAGGTGAGKTTVARAIADATDADVRMLPMDNYYADLSDRPFEERKNANYDHPDAFEWPLLRDHLDRLHAGETVEMPQYDFGRHRRTDDTVTVTPPGVLVLEGILALYDRDVRDRLDLNVYVQTDADVRILRRIERDVVQRDRDLEGVIEQYRSTVKPMHQRFVAPTKRHADVIIPEGANTVAVDLLGEKVRAEA